MQLIVLHQEPALDLAVRASAEARARARPTFVASRTSCSIAPRSPSGLARLPSALSRWISQSAVATMPMPTEGSPASRRRSVPTETPMRRDQDCNDSLRRNLATARSAPNRSIDACVVGGSCVTALEVLAIPIHDNKTRGFVNMYRNNRPKTRHPLRPPVLPDRPGPPLAVFHTRVAVSDKRPPTGWS